MMAESWHNLKPVSGRLAMAIHDIYSKRKKRMAGQLPDMYAYDEIPLALRNQIVFIADDIVEDIFGSHQSERVYDYISRTISREWGTPFLVSHGEVCDRDEEFKDAIRQVPGADSCLDIVELLVQIAQHHVDDERNNVTPRIKQLLARESPNKPSVMRESPQHLIRAAHEPDELFRL